MGRKLYAVERGGEKVLEIQHSARWDKISVLFKGTEIGGFDNEQDLLNGRKFRLSDGRKLSIKRVKRFPGAELHLDIDETPVPGADNNYVDRCKVAFGIFLFFGLMNLLFGAGALVTQNKFLLMVIMGNAGAVAAVIAGLLYIIAAVLSRQGMKAAIIGGSAFLILDIVAGAILPLTMSNMPPPIPFLVIKAFLVLYIIQGLKFAPKNESGLCPKQPPEQITGRLRRRL